MDKNAKAKGEQWARELQGKWNQLTNDKLGQLDNVLNEHRRWFETHQTLSDLITSKRPLSDHERNITKVSLLDPSRDVDNNNGSNDNLRNDSLTSKRQMDTDSLDQEPASKRPKGKADSLSAPPWSIMDPSLDSETIETTTSIPEPTHRSPAPASARPPTSDSGSSNTRESLSPSTHVIVTTPNQVDVTHKVRAQDHTARSEASNDRSNATITRSQAKLLKNSQKVTDEDTHHHANHDDMTGSESEEADEDDVVLVSSSRLSNRSSRLSDDSRVLADAKKSSQTGSVSFLSRLLHFGRSPSAERTSSLVLQDRDNQDNTEDGEGKEHIKSPETKNSQSSEQQMPSIASTFVSALSNQRPPIPRRAASDRPQLILSSTGQPSLSTGSESIVVPTTPMPDTPSTPGAFTEEGIMQDVVPEWARGTELARLLQVQSKMNPYEIFGRSRPLSVGDVFKKKKKATTPSSLHR